MAFGKLGHTLMSSGRFSGVRDMRLHQRNIAMLIMTQFVRRAGERDEPLGWSNLRRRCGAAEVCSRASLFHGYDILTSH
jgi:hypothetical protein